MMPIFNASQRAWLHERKRAARDGETLEDIVGKIQVFGKTQGRVVSSYTARLKAASKGSLSKEKRERIGKLQGVMDQLNAAMSELESVARSV